LTLDLTQYKTIVFDVHGVILDSNITKIDSYFRTAKKLGATSEQAQALVDYHTNQDGISRYQKFAWYIEEILQQPPTDELVQEYLETFSLAVSKGLMSCRVSEGIEALRNKTGHANWLAVSDDDQEETRTLFTKRQLAQYFDGGIFGGPDTKSEILEKELETGQIKMPALLIGDGVYDYQAATHAGLDFVFLSDLTGEPRWKRHCEAEHIPVRRNIKSLAD